MSNAIYRNFSKESRIVVADEIRLYRTLTKLFKDRLLNDRPFRHTMWSALANVEWIAPRSGREVLISFREAGSWIARMVSESGHMDYMAYYCQSDPGVVDEEIEDAMAAKGWKFRL